MARVDTLTAAPAIFAPSGVAIARMPITLWQAVDACDQQLRQYGMQMIIMCEHCLSTGHPHPIVDGDNTRNGSTFTMTCPHLERRLDFTT
jgi:hypothetical protein